MNRIRWLLASVVCLAVLTSAHAAPPSSSDGIVRVFNQLEVEAVVGSGAVVRRVGQVDIVLSCAHLMSEGTGEVYILRPQALPRRAVLLGIDAANDLACFAVADTRGPVIPVAAEAPRTNAELTSCGYGQQGELGINRGRMVGFSTLVGGEPDGVLEMTGSARQGDSGGPILNAERQLVGVIIGTDGQSVNGTHCRHVLAFLAQHPLTPETARQAALLAAQPLSERARAYGEPSNARPIEIAAIETKAALRGQLLWNKRSVSGTSVLLKGTRSARAEIDEQGRFEFRDLPAGPYRLQAEKVIHNTYRRADQELVIPPGTTELRVEVPLN